MKNITIKYEKIKDKEHEFTFGNVNGNTITVNEILNKEQRRVVIVKLLGFIKLYPELKNFSLTIQETNKEIEDKLNKFAQEYFKYKEVK